MKNILNKIQMAFPEMSDKHKKIARYILDNHNKAAFLTSTELAKATEVSNPTVTRFSTTLGYSGYQEMQQCLQKNVLSYLSTMDQLNNIEDKNDQLVKEMIDTIHSIPEMYSYRNISKVIEASELISSCEKVIVSGYRWCAPLVEHTCYGLGSYKKGVYKVIDNSLFNYDIIHDKTSKTCAIIFAMPRYPKALIEQMQRFKKENIPMIVFTDSEMFPYIDMADVLLMVPIKHISLPSVVPLVMIMFMVQEIICRVITNDYAEVKKRVTEFENNAKENNIYLNDDYYGDDEAIINKTLNIIY